MSTPRGASAERASTLAGRVAVVTGAGRGIGAGVARLLAAEGASVVVNDLGAALDGSGADAGPAHGVVEEIRAAGGTAVADGSDVTDAPAAEKLVRTAVDTFGKLDVLVNAAGILRDRMIFNMAESEWDDVIRVHLKGHFNTIRPAAAYWREQRNPSGHFRLINFTSVSGLFGAPGQPNYAAAKMGIVGLTYSCANALGRYGVTANAISPGAATRMTESVISPHSPAGLDERSSVDRLPAGARRAVPTERRRPGVRSDDDPERAPDNVAPVVAYIAGEASDWLTGQVIGARGYEVSLFTEPAPAAQLVGTRRWPVEELAELMERHFKPAVRG